MKQFIPWLRHAFRREDGNSTIEFAMIVPLFITIFSASFESGITMLRLNMLQHGLDVTMRDLRLGRIVAPTQTTIKQEICSNVEMISNCNERLMVEITPVINWQMPSTETSCVNTQSDVQPVVNLQIGQQNQLMLVRACLVQDLVFSASGEAMSLPTDASGEYNLIAISAYVNEPN